MSATKQAPRRLSEEEKLKRLETRTLNRIRAWDAKAGYRREHVVECLRDCADALEAWAPDGRMPSDPEMRKLFVRYREEMYGYLVELEAIRAREAVAS
ncbi:hypothetical protein [Gaiella sp.]|uniref:hypothetical protein n=1 Tax=Gaiella sp. TaxID=2663207 RepID=UPI002E30A2E2|nr:hypothetical protein [Gaiella sp.]HEX5582980.1 hypothetical protein [Gaiella sp.]